MIGIPSPSKFHSIPSPMYRIPMSLPNGYQQPIVHTPALYYTVPNRNHSSPPSPVAQSIALQGNNATPSVSTTNRSGDDSSPTSPNQ